MAGLFFSVPITLWHFRNSTRRRFEHIHCNRAAPGVHRHGGDHVVARLVARAELPRASYLTQLLYLFVLGLPMSLAGR